MTTNTDTSYHFTNTDAGTGDEIHLHYLWNLGFRNQVTTWISDVVLDNIYEHFRIIHHQNTTHHLYKNYSSDHVGELSAKSIYWGDDGLPKIICSILSRPCWPSGVYRIMNRLWKTEINTGPVKGIDFGFSFLLTEQIRWCNEHGGTAVFVSRQVGNRWQKWAAEGLEEMTGLKPQIPEGRFLTCDNENDDTCWQRIMLYGSENILNNWKRRPE